VRFDPLPLLIAQLSSGFGDDAGSAAADLNFGLRTAECIAQCSNLEHEFHHAVSKLRILGFEPLK
jgi:hypothetical protein